MDSGRAIHFRVEGLWRQMTAEEADKLIKMIKQGASFVAADLDDLLATRWKYDANNRHFVLIQIDTVVGDLFPEEIYDEESFRIVLQSCYAYDAFTRAGRPGHKQSDKIA